MLQVGVSGQLALWYREKLFGRVTHLAILPRIGSKPIQPNHVGSALSFEHKFAPALGQQFGFGERSRGIGYVIGRSKRPLPHGVDELQGFGRSRTAVFLHQSLGFVEVDVG